MLHPLHNLVLSEMIGILLWHMDLLKLAGFRISNSRRIMHAKLLCWCYYATLLQRKRNTFWSVKKFNFLDLYELRSIVCSTCKLILLFLLVKEAEKAKIASFSLWRWLGFIEEDWISYFVNNNDWFFDSAPYWINNWNVWIMITIIGH